MHEPPRRVADSLQLLTAAIGDRYRIEREVGSGGMATVYLAEDLRHHRMVAVKVLRPELAATLGPARFLREIDVAAELQHPNILPMLDSGNAGGFLYYVMPYVDGPSLRERLASEGELPIRDAVRMLAEIVDALAEAHRHGIVHRDVKPDNVLLTGRHAVVTDFGVAKAINEATGRQIVTSVGIALGTPAYMAPEQAAGDPQLDHRVDIYAVGVLAYEMLTGSRPFAGSSAQAVLAAHLAEAPEPLRSRRPLIPVALEEIVLKCLRKQPAERWQSAKELLDQLEACQTSIGSDTPLPRLAVAAFSDAIRKPKIALSALGVIAVLVGVSIWSWVRQTRVDWVRSVALPSISSIVDSGNYFAAFQLARQARQYLASDPQLEAHWRTVAAPVAIRTTPPGANVYLKDYRAGADSSAWLSLGTSPLDQVSIPIGTVRGRLTMDGFDDVEGATAWAGSLFDTVSFTLHRRGVAPTGMVFVPGVRTPSGAQPDYWIDKFEVTNGEFQQFVTAGGYQRREFWKLPFVNAGQALTWQQAMARFRDATGRAGPAAWELGRHPDDQADLPVTGVSWYEAAAYAEFVGKSLPTNQHWRHARAGGQQQLIEGMTRVSNFGGRGPARGGSHPGVSAFGAYDMSGNVREWSWNDVGGKRNSLGGAWNDPVYGAISLFLAPPLDRAPTQGFRLAKYPAPLPEALLAPVGTAIRDYRTERPASDELFAAYRRIYSYDHGDLRAVVEQVDDSPEYWREEKLTFNAAYGGDRVIAHLFLPKNAVPPYQVVIYFPGGAASLLNSMSFLDEPFSQFIVRSGRALLFPIYSDMYERRRPLVQRGPIYFRDLGIRWFQDLGRSIDYLQTRPDIDQQKLAFYGFSQGPHWGTIFMALDDRIRVGVFLAGGFPPGRPLPESDPLNFAPRVRQPVLMVNGENDFFSPLETSQRPLFRLLGTPENDKRHVVVPGSGHVVPRQAFMKEILEWLDTYLGPPRPVTAPPASPSPS